MLKQKFAREIYDYFGLDDNKSITVTRRHLGVRSGDHSVATCDVSKLTQKIVSRCCVCIWWCCFVCIWWCFFVCIWWCCLVLVLLEEKCIILHTSTFIQKQCKRILTRKKIMVWIQKISRVSYTIALLLQELIYFILLNCMVLYQFYFALGLI